MSTKKQTTSTKKIGATVQVAIVTTIGAVLVSLITGLFGLAQRNNALPSVTDNITVATTNTSEPTATLLPSRKIFAETFDNNDADWLVDEGLGSFNDSGYRTYKHIQDGRYYRFMESNENFTGAYGSIPIPKVFEKNFCLLFDAQITGASENTAVVVNARSIAFGTGEGRHYDIHLFSNGKGSVELDVPEDSTTRLVSTFNNAISWNDMQTHTVKISFQENELAIYDQATGQQIHTVSIQADKLITDDGEIRIGLYIAEPSQQTTLIFDNVIVYDRCP